jgi:hypothetical protein
MNKSVQSKSEVALHFWNPITFLLCGRLAKLIDLKLMFLLYLLAVSTLLSVSLCLKSHKIIWLVHGLVTDMKTIYVYYTSKNQLVNVI